MEIQKEIYNYIVENMLFDEDRTIDEDLSFQENGILDSIGFLELIHFIEEKYNIKISDNELIPENFDTLRKISCFVKNKLYIVKNPV